MARRTQATVTYEVQGKTVTELEDRALEMAAKLAGDEFISAPWSLNIEAEPLRAAADGEPLLLKATATAKMVPIREL